MMADKKPVPAGLYDRDYFTSNCGGFREFAETRGKVLPERLSVALEAAEIRAGMKAADIGCGRGELVLHAALKGAEVLGIDYSEEALKLARELLSGYPALAADKVKFLKADVNELRLGQDAFDVLFMTDIIEHLHPWELEGVFRKAAAALKPGGRLVAHTAPNSRFCRYGWPVVRRIVLLKESLLGTRNPVPAIHPSLTGINEKVHVNLQDPGGLERELRSAGFDEVSVFFREQGPLEGKSAWNGLLNRVFQSPPLESFFNISIFAVAKKAKK